MAEPTGTIANEALILCDFLRLCGVDASIDLYHKNELIPNWPMWTQNKILDCINNKGFILLLCTTAMKEALDDDDASSRIEMDSAHIDCQTFRHLLISNANFIPVCKRAETDRQSVPLNLRDGTLYQIDISNISIKLKKKEILDNNDSLRSLVATLTNQAEIEIPMNSGILCTYKSLSIL